MQLHLYLGLDHATRASDDFLKAPTLGENLCSLPLMAQRHVPSPSLPSPPLPVTTASTAIPGVVKTSELLLLTPARLLGSKLSWI